MPKPFREFAKLMGKKKKSLSQTREDRNAACGLGISQLQNNRSGGASCPAQAPQADWLHSYCNLARRASLPPH